MNFEHAKCAEGIRALLARADVLLKPVEARPFCQMEDWLYAIQTGALVVSPKPEPEASKPAAAKAKPAAKE